MRLVGATRGFIRAPFLIEGFLKGLLGGIIALLLSFATYVTLGRLVVQAEFFGLGLSLLGLVAGAVIGVLGSALSVDRHLRKVP